MYFGILFSFFKSAQCLGVIPFLKGAGLAAFKYYKKIFIIFMNKKIKTYKIIVDSKPFANMRGASQIEVVKNLLEKNTFQFI